MTKAKIADALRRAGRTFLQAAGAYLVLNPGQPTKALAIGAIGAGGAAVWRLLDPPESKPVDTGDVPTPNIKAGTSAGKL